MKYLILDSNNLILGWGDNPKSEHQTSTSKDIPEYDNTTQSIYWENDQIVVKDNDQKIAEKADRLKNKYQQDRRMTYDPIPEQLDQIFHDIDGWKAKIKAVKDKYPKPE